jgi:hypothetical protein
LPSRHLWKEVDMVARTEIDDDNRAKPVITNKPNQSEHFYKGKVAMPEEFDPYRKWLGIPLKDQPPHFYRLLGIALLEDDPDVIENAANRQMAHVRTFQNSKHSSLSQKILNELSAAKLCLLVPNEKSEYDASLKTKLKAEKAEKEARKANSKASAKPASQAPPKNAPPVQTPPTGIVKPVVAQPVPGQALPTGQPLVGTPVPVPSGTVPAGSVQPVASPTPLAVPSASPGPVVSTGRPSSSSRRSSRRKSSPMPMVIGAIAIIGVLIVAVAIAMNSGSTTTPANNDPEPSVVSPRPNERPRTRPNNRPRKNGVPPRKNRPNVNPIDPTPNTPDPNTPNPNEFQPAPPTFPKFEPFKEAVTEIRQALGSRDQKRAEERLLTASDHAKTPAEKETVSDLEVLTTYVTSFWSAVSRGAKEKKENPSFEHGGKKYEYIEHGSEGLVYKVDDEKFTTKIRQLPTNHAIAFADETLEADSSFGKFYLAAFLLLDGTDDNAPHRAKALGVYKQAVEAGKESESLGRALKLIPPTTSASNSDPSSDPNNTPNAPNTSNPTIDPPKPIDPTPDPNTPNPPVAVNPAAAKQPGPSDDEAKQARITMNQQYSDSLEAARRDPSARNEIARQMFAGTNSISDMNLRFVVLEYVSTAAAEAGDLELALESASQLGDQYKIGRFEHTLDALTKLSTSRGSDSKGIIKAAVKVMHEAKEQFEFGAARRAAEVGSRVASKEKLFQQQRALNTHVRWLELLADEKVRADRADVALNSDPNDARAALAIGRYLCYCKEDWAIGLPLLAKSSSAEDRDIAKAELAPPTTPEAMISLAKQWYLNGRRKKGPIGFAMLKHSEHWYTEGMTGLEPAARAEAERRLTELQDTAESLLPEEIPPLEEEAVEPDPLAPDEPE